MATDPAEEDDSLEPGSRSTDLARLTGEPVLPGERVLEQWSAPGGLGVLTNLRCLLLGHWQLGRRTARWVRELRSIGVVEVVARGALAERGPERGRRGASTGNLNDETFAVLLDNVLVFQGKPVKCEQIQRWITQARTERLRLGPDDLLPLERPGHSPE